MRKLTNWFVAERLPREPSIEHTCRAGPADQYTLQKLIDTSQELLWVSFSVPPYTEIPINTRESHWNQRYTNSNGSDPSRRNRTYERKLWRNAIASTYPPTSPATDLHMVSGREKVLHTVCCSK